MTLYTFDFSFRGIFFLYRSTYLSVVPTSLIPDLWYMTWSTFLRATLFSRICSTVSLLSDILSLPHIHRAPYEFREIVDVAGVCGIHV